MVFSNQPFHIHGAPTHLLPVYVADQRLVARIFLAHAASLRYMVFFARPKFGRFLHSFVLRVRSLTLLFIVRFTLTETIHHPNNRSMFFSDRSLKNPYPNVNVILSSRVFARFHPRRFVPPPPHDLCGRRLARSKIPPRSGLSPPLPPKSFPAISLPTPTL